MQKKKNYWCLPDGFRINRGTFDNILILRQIIDKAYEYNTQLYGL